MSKWQDAVNNMTNTKHVDVVNWRDEFYKHIDAYNNIVNLFRKEYESLQSAELKAEREEYEGLLAEYEGLQEEISSLKRDMKCGDEFCDEHYERGNKAEAELEAARSEIESFQNILKMKDKEMETIGEIACEAERTARVEAIQDTLDVIHMYRLDGEDVGSYALIESVELEQLVMRLEDNLKRRKGGGK